MLIVSLIPMSADILPRHCAVLRETRHAVFLWRCKPCSTIALLSLPKKRNSSVGQSYQLLCDEHIPEVWDNHRQFILHCRLKQICAYHCAQHLTYCSAHATLHHVVLQKVPGLIVMDTACKYNYDGQTADNWSQHYQHIWDVCQYKSTFYKARILALHLCTYCSDIQAIFRLAGLARAFT